MEAEELIEPTGTEVAESPVERTPRRSTRVRIEPERYGFLIDDDQNVTLLENDEPESYDEVMKGLECDLRLKGHEI